MCRSPVPLACAARLCRSSVLPPGPVEAPWGELPGRGRPKGDTLFADGEQNHGCRGVTETLTVRSHAVKSKGNSGIGRPN